MRKFVLSSLELFSHIAIFLILLSGVINGAITWGSSGGTGAAIAGGAIGLLVSLVACVVIFGVVFLLMDIAENTRRTAEAVKGLQDRQRELP